MALGLMAIVGGFIGVQGVIQGLLYTYPPWISGRARQTYPGQPNILPDIDTLVGLAYRGVISKGQFSANAKELGFDNTISDQIYAGSKRLLDADSYVRIWRRGFLSDGDLETELGALHFESADIENVKHATEYFPSAPDLIRFAIREVYNSSIRARFGQDEDISAEYLSEAKKAGLPEEQAKNYWAAHWELPSVGQGFEMLHRNAASQGDLDMLLKALDVMPYWRDKLQQIAYNPYTRVDVRRMHAMGVLDDAQTLQSYKDLGYDDDKADKMLTFTKRYNSDESTGITRGSVITAYKNGLLDRSTLARMLGELGYSEETTSFWVDMADFEAATESLDDKKAALFERYRVGSLTKDQLRIELGYSAAPAAYVERQIEKLEVEDAKKLKLPTKADLTDWLTVGIIDETYYNLRMLELGYMKEDIERYLHELSLALDVSKVAYLGITVYQRWLKKRIITEERFVAVAKAKEYSDTDIALMILESQEAPENVQ